MEVRLVSEYHRKWQWGSRWSIQIWANRSVVLGGQRGPLGVVFLVQSPPSWPLCMSDVLGWRLVVRIHKTAFGDAMASLWGRCMDHALVV